MRARALVVLVALLALLGVPGTADASTKDGDCGSFQSNTKGLPFTLTQTTTHQQVGTQHTITATLGDPAAGTPANECIAFFLSSGPTPNTDSPSFPQHGFTDANGQVSMTWTSGTAGNERIKALWNDTSGGTTAAIIFTWDPKPKPSPTPKPTPKPTPTPTRSRPTTSPTPSQSSSPTPSPPASATASPTTTPTTTASPTPTHAAVPTPTATDTLQVDKPSTVPGGTVGITGRHCPPSVPVSFSMEGVAAGSAVSDASGGFHGDAQLPDAPIGEHQITVTCGDERATVRVDLVVSSSAEPAGQGATVGAVLVFFVLLGTTLVSRLSGKRPTT